MPPYKESPNSIMVNLIVPEDIFVNSIAFQSVSGAPTNFLRQKTFGFHPNRLQLGKFPLGVTNMNRLVDQVAIVTGGAAGIGGSASRRLAEEGAKVLIVDDSVSMRKLVQGTLIEAGHVSELEESIARFRDGGRDVVHKPALQEDMEEGEVELF